MLSELIKPFEDRYEEYLQDESKMKGQGDSISFPKTKEEVVEIVKELASLDVPITVQGGKTGICGGAVPMGGHIMNLTNMNNIDECEKIENRYFIKVQPGVTLEELDKKLYREKLFWTPQPTETSATIGGVIATGARGIGEFFYGDTNKYIEEITIVNNKGELVAIKRGEHIFENNKCFLPNGEEIEIDLNTLGLQEDCDLIDVFIGSEGMYGVVVEATLNLIKRPKELWGISFLFEEEDGVFQFAEEIREEELIVETAAIAAIEYIDKATFKFIEELKKVATKLKELPDIEEDIIGMVYIEINGENEGDIEEIAEILMEKAMECGSDPDRAWAVSGEIEMDKVRAFRHAGPESINVTVEKYKRLDERITKLGTDMTIENKPVSEIIKKYREDAEKENLQIAIFGHIGGSHIHANIIPKNYEEYKKGKDLIKKWAIEAKHENAKIFSEHGVGKIKKELLKLVAKEDYINEAKKLKNQLDPSAMWNKGNRI
ncbi:FAD-binding oxidoreductase [Clostridium sp. DL1XJH146]